jgi:hypothetical protein
MAKNSASFEAQIKWGYSSDDLKMQDLPAAFSEAKKLWATKDEENIMRAGELIAPYVTCLFLGSNCDGDLSELFESDVEELEASSILVYGLDFSDSNLPKVKALAVFEKIATRGKLTDKKLDEWQELNGYLDNGISFEWAIEGVDEDLDLRLWNHSGLGFRLK